MSAPWLDQNATMTARTLAYEAHLRRVAYMAEAVLVVGTIWRGDHLDVLTEDEAEFWKWNLLPMGWSVVGGVS